jgi:glycosyltransferase involved in cell wall biosynthesis
MTKVTIVTAAYNAGGTIADTLKSVASQSWDNIEHIIVDGGSKDDTAALVSQCARPGSVFVSEPDKGLYDAMNKGIDQATGDIIGLLNADDIFANTDTIERMVSAFELHKTDAILGDVGYFRDGDESKIIRYYDSSAFTPKRVAWGWMPAHPAMYLTRSAYDRVGRYRLDYRIAADYEFVVRAFAKYGLSYAHLSEIVVKMRLGGISTSGLAANLTINRESVRACRENGIKTNMAMIMSKYPRKLIGLLR